MPERIYINPNPEHRTWLIGKGDISFIEYVKEDAFIEKAEGWLREVQKGFILTDKDITDFINYMKGEKYGKLNRQVRHSGGD